MSFSGYDPGDRNNWYQSPHLGPFPASLAAYGGGISGGYYSSPYHSYGSFTCEFNQFSSQPNPYPQLQLNPSATIINGHLLPHQFPCVPQTHSQFFPPPYLQPIHPIAPQPLTTTPQSPSIPTHHSPHPNPNLWIHPSIPTFQSPAAPTFVPQPQFTDPKPPSSFCSEGDCEPLALFTGRIQTIPSSSSLSSDPQTYLADAPNPSSPSPISGVPEQMEVLHSKLAVTTLMEELQKPHQSLSVAVAEEVNLTVQVNLPSPGRNLDAKLKRDDAVVPKGLDLAVLEALEKGTTLEALDSRTVKKLVLALEPAQVLLDVLVDSNVLELLVQNLLRLSNSNPDEMAAVYSSHATIENLFDKLVLAELVCENTKLLKWLMSKIKMKEFDTLNVYKEMKEKGMELNVILGMPPRMAFEKLQLMGLPFLRPEDYYAKMVKSESQLGIVKSQFLVEMTTNRSQISSFQVCTTLNLNFHDVRSAFESILSGMLKLYHNCLNGKVGEENWPTDEWIEKMDGDADNLFDNRSTREIRLDNFLVATGLAYDTDSIDMAPLGSSEMVNERSNKRQMVTSLSLMEILFSKVFRMETDEKNQAPIRQWLICCLLLCDCKKDTPTLAGTLNAWLNGNILCLSLENKLEKVSLFLADKLEKISLFFAYMVEKIGDKWLPEKSVVVMFISKDGKYLALGSKNGDICVVNVKKMEHELVELRHHISSQGVVNLLEEIALTYMGKLRDEIFLFPGGFSYDNQVCLDIIMAKQLPKAACHSIFFKLILAILRQDSSDALRRRQYALLLSYFQYFQHKLDLDIPSTVLQFLLLDAQEAEDLDPQQFNRERAKVAHANFSILQKEVQSILNSVIKDATQGSEIRGDDVKNVSIIIALQKHTNCRFDCIRRTETVKDSMAGFKTESGCILFQNLLNMLRDESHASDGPSYQSGIENMVLVDGNLFSQVTILISGLKANLLSQTWVESAVPFPLSILESFKHAVKAWLRYSSTHPVVLLTTIATALLSLKVWVLNLHGLTGSKAKLLFGGAFLIRELMFVNECHIVPTGTIDKAIDKRLVCHLGEELHVIISYSHMDHYNMCWLHTKVILPGTTYTWAYFQVAFGHGLTIVLQNVNEDFHMFYSTLLVLSLFNCDIPHVVVWSRYCRLDYISEQDLMLMEDGIMHSAFTVICQSTIEQPKIDEYIVQNFEGALSTWGCSSTANGKAMMELYVGLYTNIGFHDFALTSQSPTLGFELFANMKFINVLCKNMLCKILNQMDPKDIIASGATSRSHMLHDKATEFSRELNQANACTLLSNYGHGKMKRLVQESEETNGKCTAPAITPIVSEGNEQVLFINVILQVLDFSTYSVDNLDVLSHDLGDNGFVALHLILCLLNNGESKTMVINWLSKVKTHAGSSTLNVDRVKVSHHLEDKSDVLRATQMTNLEEKNDLFPYFLHWGITLIVFYFEFVSAISNYDCFLYNNVGAAFDNTMTLQLVSIVAYALGTSLHAFTGTNLDDISGLRSSLFFERVEML